MAKNKAKPSSILNSSKKKRFRNFSIKLAFVIICYLIFYCIYLDGKIRSKMDGQIWQLPAEVYSRIESIRLSDKLSFEQVKQRLLENNYRQTTMIAVPGDFKVENDTIVLLRGAFPFPTVPEAQRVFRLRFQNNQLAVIEDLVNTQAIEDFPLAPKLIAMLQSEKEERLTLSLQNYPRLLIDTLLLTEDRRFYQHEGISPLGIARAVVANFQAGHRVQGGSTLTQQLVKNLFLSNERTFSRKINEALMALILDWRYDKNRILETYLNEIYLGQNGNTQIHGFELASHFYFGRSIREINLDQIALLVGMVKGPSLYNPWRNPKLALERRNVVLHLLLEHKVIGQELYDMLSKRPLGVQKHGQITRKYPAFIQTLQAELRHRLGENRASSLSGTRIFSTLDIKQQQYAEQAVINAVSELQVKYKNPYLEAAMIIADYHNGEIKAIVGGRQTNYAGFNRALNAKRQIGSLVKPSIYLTALSDPSEFRLNTPIQNQPLTIHTKGSPPWQPRNYDRRYSGPVMLMDALARSLNIPTVNIGMEVGLSKVIDTQKAMGWDKVKIPKVPAMLLGSYSISPYEVAQLFQTLANLGATIPLVTIDSITNQQGDIIYQRAMQPEQVVPAQAAYQTLYAMQQTVEYGTARSLQSQFSHLHLAGKTGTTNSARDTWFVGIDGENLATVWLGRDDNGETKLTGATGALQVYKNYLQRTTATALYPSAPEGIKWVGITSYGSWDCNSSRQIPVWADRNQSFCTEQETPKESEQPKRQSLWDVLIPSSNSQAAPVEEAVPAN
ncbi:penicillin-binding protein 1B [Avibacterium paragallinarum]|uniref:Penicillin-binding protein 1B n=1 Tax=Avibacterium paragallinarum TaxID=728 RepID=A0AAE5TIX1_AVIPA|nr:penicillin-binding protein 1B [Avibacterium paragallinarum]MEE3608020.1 penicillin-binding protein 1B [Avibacterium paragallinarum]MEE3620458.1 penicillin-binding protein 1B [Avibacterium paragallinarum]MEE3667930.1 penicillin-binding protein 1B [Avibacterium paragallinarum]MEE3679865.1 penicillin-binding protein 1B [Avibacterium paragallinarum]MEE4384986.1 penicillin-binding protein 1B [Avibacterium paragallinarum]